MVKNEIMGRRFGRLIVLSFQEKRNGKRYMMLCQCDCGSQKIIDRSRLVSGNTLSCGCLNSEKASKRKLKDETGEKYNNLTVIRRDGSAKDHSAMWLCRCDCGEVKRINGKKLRSGHTTSCGCNQIKAMQSIKNPFWRGGLSKSPYPLAWTGFLRNKIRNRDKKICQICGKIETQNKHCVHHIDYNKTNLNPFNLITICRKCHVQTNKDRRMWQNRLRYTVGYWQCYE